MNSFKLIAATSVTGVLMAGAIATPVFAWHPKGTIIKYVQNQTTGGQMTDANDAASAVSAKPGDTIKYTIVVSNTGAAASNGYNDMYYTKLTDTLPAGVELASDPAKRQITEDLGVLKPGQKVTKEYVLKVTSTKNGDVVINEACFTGDSEVKDNKQEGCDKAVIKVTVPTPPTTPEPPKTPPVVPPVTPTPPVVPPAPAAELPATGPGNLISLAGVSAGLGYVGNLLRLKRRNNRKG